MFVLANLPIFLAIFVAFPSLAHAQPCAPSDCSGHGLCVGQKEKNMCLCESGYLGTRCELELCSHIPGVCSGHGLCLGTSSAFLCLCEPGFAGRQCEQQQNGTSLRMPSLRLPIQKFFSPSERSENNAKTPPVPTICPPAQCHDRGICFSSNSAGQEWICICQLGFNGLRCENDLLRKTVELLQSEGLFGNHSNGANASGVSANGTALCSPKDCNDQGICLGQRAKARCLCNFGFGGRKCESVLLPSMCSAAECSGRGTCLGTSSWHTCACQPGWAGRRCEQRSSEKKFGEYWAQLERNYPGILPFTN